MSFMVCLIAGALVAGSTPETAGTLIEKHVEARGGLERLRAVRSLRAAGRMRIGERYEATFTHLWKKPSRARIEVAIRGRVSLQVLDGNQGWQLAHLRGQPEFVPLPPELAAELARGIDLEGPLLDPARKGYRVRLLGREPVEGASAWKLELTSGGGELLSVFVDAESFLEVKEVRSEPLSGRVLETTFSDYRRVDGLLMPHRLTTVLGGRLGDTTIIEKLELNPRIDDAEFRKLPSRVEDGDP
jgi:hypothetical protein